MDERNIPERVREVMAHHLGIEADKLTDGAALADDLNCDSLDFLELVMAAEEEFGVDLPDADWEKVVTVGDAIKTIQAHAPR